MSLDVAIYSGRKSFVDIACILRNQLVAFHGTRVGAVSKEIGVHAVAPEPATHLAPRAEQSECYARPVIFELYPGESKCGGPKILCGDVRNAISRPPDFHPAREVFRLLLPRCTACRYRNQKKREENALHPVDGALGTIMRYGRCTPQPCSADCFPPPGESGSSRQFRSCRPCGIRRW